MRAKLISAAPEQTLDRVLDALAEVLIDASDEEIIAAAQELGMNPMMKGSAAFIGLRMPAMAELADFFATHQGSEAVLELQSTPKLRRWKRTEIGERKH